VPYLSNNLKNLILESEVEEDAQAAQEDWDSEFILDDSPKHFAQNELNDLIRNVGLSKNDTELLGSRHKEKIC